ncbi:DNA (cytosine-5-)-methyltransferase [Bacillus sp. MZGC1]|uniref:DNA (cytosine-5-)-methyltransferase n=1 Tax=Bacillus sp. MZGC1 TaxID=2108543 RepID=UPI000D03371A|nr:DNA (cytosine-5-)-methyltransferase [Bacillus sp. MZGC1]PRS47567.1 DNA (cytosine-5-)-methyltransferase [Bacillus sp. MZGC1]
MEKLKVMSLFSGIGAFEAALRNIGMNYELVGFSEIDQFAIKSYCAIHSVDKSLNFGDVTEIEKEKLPDFDILVGGSPCQSFSVAGHRKGFEDTHGTLFFEYVQTLLAKKPKYFIFENVKGLLNHDKGKTIEIIAKAFRDAGYCIDLEIMNSKYFNVPQQRERLFIIGIRVDKVREEKWIKKVPKNTLQKGKERLDNMNIKTFNFNWPLQLNVHSTLNDVLERSVDEKFYISEEKSQNLLTNNQAIEYSESKFKVNKIGNVHPSGKGMNGTVYSSCGLSPTITTNKGEGIKILIEKERRVRKETPLECFRLQAFSDHDFYKARSVGNSNTQLYKLAANSITVTVLEEIFKELLHTYK